MINSRNVRFGISWMEPSSTLIFKSNLQKLKKLITYEMDQFLECNRLSKLQVIK